MRISHVIGNEGYAETLTVSMLMAGQSTSSIFPGQKNVTHSISTNNYQQFSSMHNNVNSGEF